MIDTCPSGIALSSVSKISILPIDGFPVEVNKTSPFFNWASVFLA